MLTIHHYCNSDTALMFNTINSSTAGVYPTMNAIIHWVELQVQLIGIHGHHYCLSIEQPLDVGGHCISSTGDGSILSHCQGVLNANDGNT